MNRIFLLLTVLILLLGTTMPGPVKSQIEGQLWSGIPWSGLGHFAGFVALATCLARDPQLSSWERLIPTIVFFAVTTELLQFLAHERHPRLLDIGIDLAGALVGWMALRTIAANRPAAHNQVKSSERVEPVQAWKNHG